MELGKYVQDYEAAQAERRQEAERERERQRIAREVNAEAAEKCLKDIIAPVLVRARDQLVAENCTSDIIWKSRDDMHFKLKSPKMFAIEIVLKLSRPGNEPAYGSKLSYEGSFQDQTIQHQVDILGATTPKTARIPIETITEGLIEQHVDAFVRAVFGIKAAS
jgi:hypothetical protein